MTKEFQKFLNQISVLNDKLREKNLEIEMLKKEILKNKSE